MPSRRPGPIHAGRLLVFAALAVVLMAAEDSCSVTQFVTVQVCNGDPADKVLVVVEVQTNHAQQTLAPGVCLGVVGASILHQEVVPYRISPADSTRYRAEMSALRDEIDGRYQAYEAGQIGLADLDDQVLSIRGRIDTITQMGIGQACSGMLNVGEQLRVSIVRDASGAWVCGQKELTTAPPSSTP